MSAKTVVGGSTGERGREKGQAAGGEHMPGVGNEAGGKGGWGGPWGAL